MTQSEKLYEEVLALVRHEADLEVRSLAGQISHLLRPAIGTSGSFDSSRIDAAPAASLVPGDLKPDEHDVWLNVFGKQRGA